MLIMARISISRFSTSSYFVVRYSIVRLDKETWQILIIFIWGKFFCMMISKSVIRLDMVMIHPRFMHLNANVITVLLLFCYIVLNFNHISCEIQITFGHTQIRARWKVFRLKEVISNCFKLYYTYLIYFYLYIYIFLTLIHRVIVLVSLPILLVLLSCNNSLKAMTTRADCERVFYKNGTDDLNRRLESTT